MTIPSLPLRRSARTFPLVLALAAAAVCAPLTGCDTPTSVETATTETSSGAATKFTQTANSALGASLPTADTQDFEDARRGLIASEDNIDIPSSTKGGPAVWRTQDYAFVQGDAPSTVNPSLWRQAKLNGIHGLFRVTEGVYQVRGYDISNISMIRGRSGWIVVDPLTAKETAAAALALFRRNLGNDPIVAVIFTHSHADHFGGVGAVFEDPHTDSSKVQVFAPEGFLEEATSENVLAGIAMGRRAGLMYGSALPRSAQGHVDTGLGKAPAMGTIAIAEPTVSIDSTPQDIDIDGVTFRFQYTPASEAPAEMTFYLPAVKAFCGAEIISHTLHNLYTLRGAKVRDALKWSGYIDQAMQMFGDADVVFASHHWPTFGNERAMAYMAQQRDSYRYIHDQTLRLANAGLGPQEIAEELVMPSALRPVFANRDYYGTVRHNAKAVYQAYFGWYDGNPANLNPLPPRESATRYVEAMGGATAVLARANQAYASGEYRWGATLLNHLVFAEPSNEEARHLLADTYRQLGYQAESGPWRDIYLSGAFELRHGPQPLPLKPAAAVGLLLHLSADRFFDAMAVRLNGPSADGKLITLNFVFTDLNQTHVVKVENAVLHHRLGEADPGATATIRLTREFLVRLSTGQAGLRETIFSKELEIDGSKLDVLSFFALLDRPDGQFPIVTP